MNAVAPLLEVRHLCKSYGGAAAVDDLSFFLPAATCLGLLGPNGAGKTTTLKLCLGLAAPDSGTIELAGESLPQGGQRARRRVGVAPQFDNLDPDFSVAENLLVFGRYFGMKDAEIRARIPALLEFSGLAHKQHERIASLSGGMKRRLTLARALVNDPDLVVLDEPTTGLDPQARRLIWERLKQLKSSGKTLLLTTHFMEEAERLCDTLIVVDHGKKIAEGSPRELIARHIEPRLIEVCDDAPGALAAFLADWRPPPEVRCETVGDTLLLYCSVEAAPGLATALARQPGLRLMQRAANLEDVFIRLTGRELRD